MRIEGVKVLGRGRAAPIKYSVFPCAEHSDEPHRTGSMPPEDDTLPRVSSPLHKKKLFISD
jgi:hypothetical protein